MNFNYNIWPNNRGGVRFFFTSKTKEQVAKEKEAKSNNVRNTEKYKLFRSKVMVRDGFQCLDCGCEDMDRLQVHHIKPVNQRPELVFQTNNAMTLCNDCHNKRHEND